MVPIVLRRLSRVPRLVVRHVRWRAAVARRFEHEPLDLLLHSLAPLGARNEPLDAVAAAVRLGERVGARVPGWPNTCLFRALTRFASLRSAGHEARFVMGIDADDATVGHAWVEVAGRPWLEPASTWARAAPFRRTLEHPPDA